MRLTQALPLFRRLSSERLLPLTNTESLRLRVVRLPRRLYGAPPGSYLASVSGYRPERRLGGRWKRPPQQLHRALERCELERCRVSTAGARQQPRFGSRDLAHGRLGGWLADRLDGEVTFTLHCKLLAAGFWSLYDRNIYDGHYTLPQTLVMHR